ncbi:MAG: hypothetical protein AB8B55_06545 [Mariniblastus sp.]
MISTFRVLWIQSLGYSIGPATKLGEYKITDVSEEEGQLAITVKTPLPKSVQEIVQSRPNNEASMRKKAETRNLISGMIDVEFVGSDGLTYQPQSSGTSSNGTTTKTFSSTSRKLPNGRRIGNRGSGGGSNTLPGTRVIRYGFAELPDGVSIDSVKIQVRETPESSVEIPFELKDVRLK